MTNLEDRSYSIHQNTYSKVEKAEGLSLYRNWFESNTTDIWRHLRMLSVLNPFLKHHPHSSWLTVGDGNFGTSAIYINKNGGNALASDIDIRLLEVAKQENMLPNFAYANAEKLPFDNNAYQYTYCKMAYHHFPRPAIAVYEMLRVSAQAAIFTEPSDYVPTPALRRILQKTKNGIKHLMGKPIPHHDTGNYEISGNYVFTISVREFEKIAQGLGLPCIAYKKFHDVYIEGVEHETWVEDAPLFKKIKKEIAYINRLTLFKLSDKNSIQMIIFKSVPADTLKADLKADGYTIITFPPNPYL